MEHVSVHGQEIPKIGLGTYHLSGDTCYDAVREAIELGYRHIDTAAAYGNESEVGAAIADSGVDRDDIFLTTKVTGYNARRPSVRSSAERSVNALGVDAVDLLLIHWFFPLISIKQTMAGLSDCVADGVARNIGVSNYGVSRLKNARRHADAAILTDQVQFNPYWSQDDLLEYCKNHDVLLTAYSPLIHGGIVNDTVLKKIGDRYDKSPAQVAIRWVVQHENVVTIPKSTDSKHLVENLEVFDFDLSNQEMYRIARPSKLRSVLAWVRGRYF